jgi:dihydropyrimidinase
VKGPVAARRGGRLPPRADGKAAIDYAFHLIVSDPTPEVLTPRAAGAGGEGYTSFKIYMTYDD